MNCNNNQNNNNGCGCNCNPHPTPAPKPVDINMNVCDRNINMLPMLQTYTTKVLKPNINGCCKKNILTQEMMNCEDMKYVIKWDFDLNGKTITVPENCILEFDGGSLCNGTIIGQGTFINDVGGLGIDVVFGENITREGTWRQGSIPDKPYDPTAHSGLGRKIFKLKEDGSNILTQEDFNDTNTIYVVQYDFDLDGESVTIPENCVLEFEGGCLSNGTLVGSGTIINDDAVGVFELDIVLDGMWNMDILRTDWFKIKSNDSSIDFAAILNNLLTLSHSRSAKIKLPCGTFYIKSTIRVNGVVLTLDEEDWLEHNNTVIEGYGNQTKLINLNFFDIFNIAYCKNLTIKDFSIENDPSMDDFVLHHPNKAGINGVAIINCKNVKVQNIHVGHLSYYPRTIDDDGSEYFDGGKGITIQGNLFRNVVVDSCVVEDCVYGLDLTTHVEFYNDEDSRISVNRVYVKDCFRGLIVTSGGNRDESVYSIQNNLIQATDIMINNCFQPFGCQQAMGVLLQFNVVNTKTITELAKRPNGTSWHIKDLSKFTDSMKRSILMNAGSAANCKIVAKLHGIYTNAMFASSGSCTRSGKRFENKNNSYEIFCNENVNIVPQLGADSITWERKIAFIQLYDATAPHYKYCEFKFWGINDSLLADGQSDIPTVYMLSENKSMIYVDGNLYVSNLTFNVLSGIKDGANNIVSPVRIKPDGNILVIDQKASSGIYPSIGFAKNGVTSGTGINNIGLLYKEQVVDSNKTKIAGGGYVFVYGRTNNPLGHIKVNVADTKGGTTSRPVLTTDHSGFCYYDVELGKPIWWNGTKWVLADGTDA